MRFLRRVRDREEEPPMIATAARWAAELEYPVKHLSGKEPGSARQNTFCYGRYLFVGAPTAGDLIWVFFYFPMGVAKETFSGLGPEMGERRMAELETLISSNPRNRVMTQPEECHDLSKLGTITIQRTVRISTRETSTFNQYADALREVAATGRSVEVFVQALPYIIPKPPESTTPPSEMYR